jgi:hypothetical protein
MSRLTSGRLEMNRSVEISANVTPPRKNTSTGLRRVVVAAMSAGSGGAGGPCGKMDQPGGGSQKPLHSHGRTGEQMNR